MASPEPKVGNRVALITDFPALFCGCYWVLSLAIPFYGTINTLFPALSIGATAFVLSCAAFNWYYCSEQRRNVRPVKVPWPLGAYGWKPLFAINIFLFSLFVGTTVGAGIYYSFKQLVSNIHTFHWFAAC
ncbi:hypothetical protein WJX84_006096 [Apatococcus fuscideae]|uniref:Transmembrane 9 superfamily member n=1 Tax=Apatococcus fuscideae TaxID=2026836 RepID=A0AAW1T4R4_9CHLO